MRSFAKTSPLMRIISSHAALFCALTSMHTHALRVKGWDIEPALPT